MVSAYGVRCIVAPTRGVGSSSRTLNTYSAEEMTCWPLSPRVGNVKNNDPSLMEPIAAK